MPGLSRFHTDDVGEANRHAPPGWTQTVYRLGSGPFSYAYARLALPGGVDLEHARFVGATRLIGDFERDAVHILFPYGKDLRFSGVPVGERLVVITLPGGAHFEGATQVEGAGYNIALRGEAFEELRNGLEGDAFASLAAAGKGSPVIVRETAATETLRTAIEGIFRFLEQDEPLVARGERIKLAREDLLDLARIALTPATPLQSGLLPASQQKRRALALAAEKLIWSRTSDPEQRSMSLPALCAVLDTSVRTLQFSIEEHFGISFVKFVRAARLHKVHASLLDNPRRESVSEIATRHGFWHLGRFSRYYRELFGKPPSVTHRVAGRRRC